MIKTIFCKSKREEGVQVLSVLLIIIFAIVFYLGLISWRPFLGYFYIKDTATDAVKPGYFKNKSDYVPTENEVESAIMETAKSWKIPLSGNNVKLQRNKENITVTVDYKWSFNIFGYRYVKRYHFTQVGEKVQ